ncbi:polyprenyl synthetase family protein [Streptomyces virginiae]|uniref:polyprenyl synthetase family protein n=1 Tax=Streptomyces virginiae TaxID=1961 RepID=UPI00381D0E99
MELPIAAGVDFRAAVEALLEEFLRGREQAARLAGLPAEVPAVLLEFVRAGGKRVRPLLCGLGWQAAGGGRAEGGAEGVVVRVAASLELFHAFALIHDDLMDRSDLRRGRPTVHRRLAARARDGRGSAGAQRLGESGAVLVGDVALAWSAELLHTAGLASPQLAAALARTDAMRTAVMYGQYLDLLATGHPGPDMALPLKVIRYKTAGYTFEHPLLLGAELADADPRLLGALSAYGMAAGEAFQLHDDLLGVFGRPGQTGKPVLDDLREGKHTVLLALAYQRADAGQLRVLRRWVGDPQLSEDQAVLVRAVLERTGARAEVEALVRARSRQAVEALDAAPVPCEVQRKLAEFAQAMTVRCA